MARSGVKLTLRHKRVFFETLEETGNVSAACLTAGISRRSAYRYRDKDKKFASRWEEAATLGGYALEDEARRRAVEGTLKPVFYRGERCGAIREFSDTLLIVLLKGTFPDKYADRQQTTHMFKEDLVAKLKAVLKK